MANDESFRHSLDQLPPAVLCTIITKLDLASICSVAATCSTFKDCVSQILSFLSVFQILVSFAMFFFKLSCDQVCSFYFYSVSLCGLFLFVCLANESMYEQIPEVYLKLDEKCKGKIKFLVLHNW